VALPRVDTQPTTDDLTGGLHALVRAVHARWPQPGVPKVQVLPATVGLAAIADPPDAPGVVIGLSERDLGPVRLDLFGTDPHLLVYGDAQSGKSTVLRTLLTQLVTRLPPDRLGVVLVDYRRSHLELVPDKYLVAYCTSARQTLDVAHEVAASVAQRLPGPDVTPAQVRDRSWWQGLELLVVADDYDLVTTQSGTPLTPLVDLLPQGRDLGLHLAVARRTGGASRALYEPVIRTLSDLAGPGLLLSGDRLEGRLVNGIASTHLPPGRAILARRGRPPEQVQVAWTPPPHEPDAR
jgi:S-DNA-T family DNA segregation ATPase FtsK/SpoIIIE